MKAWLLTETGKVNVPLENEYYLGLDGYPIRSSGLHSQPRSILKLTPLITIDDWCGAIEVALKEIKEDLGLDEKEAI